MAPETLILLIVFVALLLLGVPVAVCIGLSALATMTCIDTGGSGAAEMAQRLSAGIASFPLLAIPFFILSGILMGQAGMARRLMELAASMVGRFPGGLAYVNTLTCMLFGSVSGSATAAVSSIGGFMIPQMEERGYTRPFAVALTATSATTGLLIPPSNIMIVYAVIAGNVSVATLFIAGLLPGAIMGLAIMAASFLVCSLRSAERSGEQPPKFWPALLHALPSLLLIIIVLGGILGGVFSPTEASAIAVAYALFLGACYGTVAVKHLPSILLKSAKITAVVMLLVGTSQAMSWVLALEQIPQAVSTAMLSLSDNPFVILFLINVLLLVVGTFMDMTPAVLIFTPIFLPVVTRLGMDPVQFGIVLIANLCIGLCTPPVGTCLFVGCSVGHLPIAQVVKPMAPFFIAMVLALFVITYVPLVTLWLPHLLGY